MDFALWKSAKPGERMRQTYLTPEAAQWLVDRGAHALGIEPASPDHVHIGWYDLGWGEKPTPNPPPWPAHGILLQNDVYIIEGLTNLDRIKGQRVRFAAPSGSPSTRAGSTTTGTTAASPSPSSRPGTSSTSTSS